MNTDPTLSLVEPGAKRKFKLPQWPGPAKYIISGFLILEVIGILIGRAQIAYSTTVLTLTLMTYGYDGLARWRLKRANEGTRPRVGDRYQAWGSYFYHWVTAVDAENATYSSGWGTKTESIPLDVFQREFKYTPAPFVLTAKAKQWLLERLPAGYDVARLLLFGSRLASAAILWSLIGPWSFAMSAAFILALIPREWLGYEDASRFDFLRVLSEFLIVVAGLFSAAITFGFWGFLIILAFALGYLLLES